MILMLFGCPVSGKSTAAKRLEEWLNNNNIPSKVIKSVKTRDKKSLGGFNKDSVDESLEKTKQEKDESYYKMTGLAKSEIKNGMSPILDATHHKYYRRIWVYELAKETNSDLYIIWCVLEDAEKLKNILDARKTSDHHDNVLSSLDAYKVMQEQTDEITDKEIKDHNLKIIRYCWNKKELSLINCEENPLLNILVGGLSNV